MLLSREGILAVGEALVEAVRDYIPNSDNLFGINSLRPGTRAQYFVILDKVIRKSPKKPFTEYEVWDSYEERMSKRAIQNGVGRCGELVNTIITLLKMTILNIDNDLFCSKISTESHAITILHNQEGLVFLQNMRFEKRNFNFGEFPDPNAVLCDPWIFKTVLIDNHEEIISSAINYDVSDSYKEWNGDGINQLEYEGSVPLLRPTTCYQLTREHFTTYPNLSKFRSLQLEFYNKLNKKGYYSLVPFDNNNDIALNHASSFGGVC